MIREVKGSWPATEAVAAQNYNPHALTPFV